MGKIEGIGIKNYGPLENVKMGRLLSDNKAIPLGNMVTIIGPSGNGKSTIADVFGFISDCIEKDVATACDLNNRGGFEQLRTQNATGPIEFEIYYKENANSSPITYELAIAADKNGLPYVKKERLRQRKKGNKGRGRPLSFLKLENGKGYAYEGKEGGEDEEANQTDSSKDKKDVELNDPRKLGIVTLGAMKQYTRIEKFLQFLRSWYLCYFAPDTARQPQSVAPTPYLDRSGGNLNNVAQYMYREDPKNFQIILDDIQTKLPNIEEIKPLKLQNGQIVLEFKEKGFDEPFYSQKMSDGTLKLFAYYLLLHEKNPRQLVFIEEPENGLYHQYLSALALEMAESVSSGYKKQLFVTTHSPFFVNALKPESVWVLSKDNSGFSSAKRASDYNNVEELFDEGIYLGDLWNERYFG